MVDSNSTKNSTGFLEFLSEKAKTWFWRILRNSWNVSKKCTILILFVSAFIYIFFSFPVKSEQCSATTVQVDKKFLDFTFRLETEHIIVYRQEYYVLWDLGTSTLLQMGGIPLEEKEAKVRENLCIRISYFHTTTTWTF